MRQDIRALPHLQEKLPTPGHVLHARIDRMVRQFDVLQQLIVLDALSLHPAVDQTSVMISSALGADTVEVYVPDMSSRSLIAIGEPRTALAKRRRRAALHHLPFARGGLAVRVFHTGTAYLTGDAERDPFERALIARTLHIQSEVLSAIRIDGKSIGVVEATSEQPDQFRLSDLRFIESVAAWFALVVQLDRLLGAVPMNAAHDQSSPLRVDPDRLPLTPREREVAVLVAQGLTNEEIAECLVLAPGTVSNHVEHILRKLGVNRRVQIATWVVMRGEWRPR